MKFKKIILIISFFALVSVIGASVYYTSAQSNLKKKTIYMTASWSYNFSSIEEISNESDIIALVNVNDVKESGEMSGVPYTIYNAEVIKPVYGAELGDIIPIIMTGSEESGMEIMDDPLLKKNEKFLIFARINEDGTVTLLGGPEGRLKYKNGKLNSLQVVIDRVKKSNPYMSIKVENADSDTLIEEIKTKKSNN